MQNNKTPKAVNFLIFAVSSLVLLADAVFIAVATKFDLYIVVPGTLSAAFLIYCAARFTILNEKEPPAADGSGGSRGTTGNARGNDPDRTP